MQVSVVIPTCNRKKRLLALLQCLEYSSYPVHEVIVVDSGEEVPDKAELAAFPKLKTVLIKTEKSVCIQRNAGIRHAASPWIFLCDDDVEFPADYLEKLVQHVKDHPGCGAVSGSWLQKVNGNWQATYPENSTLRLLWKYIFMQSIWGEISGGNFISKMIKTRFSKKGNHLSKAGWPVITDFSGDSFRVPVYSLGAALVKKEWLLLAPFDEALDRHGIGENYGVIADFPVPGIAVTNQTVVYHQQEPANRLQAALQYYRRVLALDYFIKTKQSLSKIKRVWLFWSLKGHFLYFLFTGKIRMMKASFKAMWIILTGRNPYFHTSKQGNIITEPDL